MVSDVQVSAVVNVMVGGEKVGSRKVHFRPMYNRLRIIAKGDVSAGTVLSAENVRLEKYISRHPEKKAVKLPVGLIAKRNIRAGQVVRNSALAHAKPEILIKRNALVVIKIETPLLKLSVEGKALGEAAFGELIKVRNVDSKRTILCKVNFDGTVSPAI